MKAVIMAGGDGKRLRPLSCTMPKPMVPLLNKPVLGYCLELIKKHGFDDVKIVSAETAVKPVRLSITNPYVRVLVDSLRDAYNQEPIVYPSGGGSGPLKMFTDSVGVDTVILPLCAADQCEHSPNENMKLIDFENGLRATATMMIRLGEMKK